MSVSLSAEVLDQYGLLARGEGFVDLGNGSTVTLTGKDRQKFFNNFCTNDVLRLTPGIGCEAFITSVQGKTLGHVLVTCRENSLVLTTVPNQAAMLVAYLERYLFREQVEIRDTTAERSYLWVGGPATSGPLMRFFESLDVRDWLANLAANEPIQGIEGQMGDAAVYVIASDLLGGTHSYLIEHAPADGPALKSKLVASGFTSCDLAAMEPIRLEAGLPIFGIDFDDSNLPQEIGRNERAISFTKGCYVGQETVARIDALGHVNRLLVGLTFPASSGLAAGTELQSGGKAVGRVTSMGFSPKLDAGIGMALVRRGFDVPGSRFESERGAAEVVALPIASRSA
jgi:folate-binding protein YgfZ